MRSLIALLPPAFIISSCAQDTETSSDTNHKLPAINGSHSNSTSLAWKAFFESSDNGLWENDSTHYLSFSDTSYLIDPSDEIPLVFSPFAMCAINDTVFVADLATQKIHAIDLGGSQLWEIGGAGEGPGEFPYISTLAVSSKYLTAINNRLGRVDFFFHNGEYSHCQPIQQAQDIVAIDDTTFIVGSTSTSGGDLHILTSSNGIVKSFGSIPQEHYSNIRRLDLIRLCYNGIDKVAVFNRYEGFISIYDIFTEECLYSGRRTYPMLPSPPLPLDDNGRYRHFPIGGNCFVGREGMLNVTLPNVMNDSTFVSTPEYTDYAPVTIVDRYDWVGTYLDTYCLPDSCLSFTVPVDYRTLVVINYAEGAVKLITSY